jgi:hypothetical protein
VGDRVIVFLKGKSLISVLFGGDRQGKVIVSASGREGSGDMLNPQAVYPDLVLIEDCGNDFRSSLNINEATWTSSWS